MKINLIISTLLLNFLFAAYGVGDVMSVEHQYTEFDFCYPEELAEEPFKFADFNRDFNGGDDKVIMISFVATW